MADETGAPNPVETPQPAAEPVVEAPVVETPAAEPVVETPVEPVVETPAEAPAEETPAEETPAEPVVEETPAEEPAAEEPPAEEAPPEEAAKPVYEDFKLPEGIKAAPEQVAAYHEVLGKYGLSQEAGQELIELHANAIKETAQQITDQMVERQTEAFNDMRATWRDQFEKDAGNRRNTILDDAKFAVTDTIKSADVRKEFWGALALTGAGDHPAVVKGLAAIGKRLREGSAPPKGLPANTGNGQSRADRRYGARN